MLIRDVFSIIGCSLMWRQFLPRYSACLDDINIMNIDTDDLIQRLSTVLARIRDLTVRADKCNFLVNSVEYFGFIIYKDGHRPDFHSTVTWSVYITLDHSVYIRPNSPNAMEMLLWRP